MCFVKGADGKKKVSGEGITDPSKAPGEPAEDHEAGGQPGGLGQDEQNDRNENGSGQNDQNDTDLPPDVQTQVNAVGDRFNEHTVTAAVNTSAPGRKRAAGEEENVFFDSLPLKEENTEDTGGPAANGEGELRAGIKRLRKGNLYKAVLVGRQLNEGKKNPLASSAAGRVSRFLDSSALDTASDFNTIAGSGIGMLTGLDTNPAAKTTFQAMSLVTNLLTMVSTCRNMAVKIRKLYGSWEQHKAGQHVSKLDTTLMLLGMVSDTLLLMVKGVAVAKSIMSMAGKNSKIMNMISNAMFLLTGTTQIIGALNGIRGVQKGYAGLKKLKAAVAGPQAAAMSVVERKKNLPEGTTESWSESERIKAVKELLGSKNNKNGGAALSEEEEDKLVLYLGMTKQITKSERGLAVSAATLVNLTIALASTGVSGANTVINGRGIKDKTLKDAAVGMGMVANASNIAATSAKIANKAAGSVGSSRNLIKQSLWGKILKLTANHRGLKWLDHSLAKAPEDRTAADGMRPEIAAAETIALYEETNAQFGAMRVPYAQLLRAGSKSKFQNLLVDSL